MVWIWNQLWFNRILALLGCPGGVFSWILLPLYRLNIQELVEERRMFIYSKYGTLCHPIQKVYRIIRGYYKHSNIQMFRLEEEGGEILGLIFDDYAPIYALAVNMKDEDAKQKVQSCLDLMKAKLDEVENKHKQESEKIAKMFDLNK